MTVTDWILVGFAAIIVYGIVGVGVYGYLVERAKDIVKEDAEVWALAWIFVPLLLLGWSFGLVGLYACKAYARAWRRLWRRPTDPAIPIAVANEVFKETTK